MRSKVLVVDDDRHIVTLLTQLFHDEGFEVAAATDGLMALEYIERGETDVVVADVMMPRVDGITLARLLQARSSPIPVVLISAVSRRLDLPNVPFVRKPFDVDHLLLVVNGVLDRAAD